MKKIKEFTREELKEYRRLWYLKNREKILQKQKKYDEEHKDERKRKSKERYKIKCGLNPPKTYKERPKTKAQLIEENEQLKARLEVIEKDRDYWRTLYGQKQN